METYSDTIQIHYTVIVAPRRALVPELGLIVSSTQWYNRKTDGKFGLDVLEGDHCYVASMTSPVFQYVIEYNRE